MYNPLFFYQGIVVSHDLYYCLVCFEYKLSFKSSRLFCKFSFIINRRIDVESVFGTDLIILFSMPGCNMYDTRSLADSYKISGKYLSMPFDEGVLRNKALKVPAVNLQDYITLQYLLFSECAE